MAIRFAVGVARFDRSIKATTNDPFPIRRCPGKTRSLARSRKPEVARVTSLRRRRGPRRSTSCRADGVSAGRGLRKCIPGKFQADPAAFDTRDRGFTRSSTISLMLDLSLGTHPTTSRTIWHLKNHSCLTALDLTERNCNRHRPA